jgi:hypothetical protein
VAAANDSAPGDTGASRGSTGSTGKSGNSARPARAKTAAPQGTGQPPYGRPPVTPIKQTGPSWKVRPDGTRVFRLITPLVLWWAWVVFAAGNLIDLAVQGRTWFDVQAAVSILAVTGVMYAFTLRPRVLTKADGITVYNPLRMHRIAFGRVKGLYLGDSVEIVCGRVPGKKDKTIYCWALYSSRRSRLRAANPRITKRFTSRHAPQEAQTLARQQTGHIMAEELARLVDEAHDAQKEQTGQTGSAAGETPASPGSTAAIPGADVASANGSSTDSAAGTHPAFDPAKDGADEGLIGTLESNWDWQAVAVVLVPVAALISVILVK